MTQILKRIFFFIVLIFIFINTVTFLLLNSPLIQKSIVSYINKNYLNPENLSLSLNSLSLNFFSAALNLNEISITELENNKNNARGLHFSVNQLSIGIDIPASYLHRKPILKKVMIRGVRANLNYDEHGKLILPDFLKSKDDDPIDIPHILAKSFPLLPREINLLNMNIILGRQDDKNFQYINVSALDALKVSKDEERRVEVKVISNGTLLRFPFLQGDIKLNQLQLLGNLRENGQLDVSSLRLDSNILRLNTIVRAVLHSKIENSNYEIHVKSLELLAENFFQLFGLKSQGTALLTGVARTNEKGSLVPVFTGKLSWQDLFLQQFSLYSGQAELHFKDKLLAINMLIFLRRMMEN